MVGGEGPLISLYRVVPLKRDKAVPDPDRILRLRTVLDRTGLSRSTLYRKIGDGSFPRQIRISIHGAGWRESDVNIWLANLPAYHLDTAYPDSLGCGSPHAARPVRSAVSR